MMNLIERARADGRQKFGSGFFDLIVIDEAHRSVYRKYRAIFDWFDAPLVGLTATPKDEVDKNTYDLFELETGVPTDAYDLKQAVEDEFLVPPRARDVPMQFPREGIRYDDLSEEEKEAWDAADWGEDGPPDSVDPAAVNDWLFNEDTIDKMLEQLMRDGLKVDEGETLGKTIIFAVNQKHAEFIESRFDASLNKQNLEAWMERLSARPHHVGSPHGKADGFSYSAALKGKGEPWAYENMNAWLLKPNSYAPGTRMAFAGIGNTQQRADVIAYLKSISPKAPNP